MNSRYPSPTKVLKISRIRPRPTENSSARSTSISRCPGAKPPRWMRVLMPSQIALSEIRVVGFVSMRGPCGGAELVPVAAFLGAASRRSQTDRQIVDNFVDYVVMSYNYLPEVLSGKGGSYDKAYEPPRASHRGKLAGWCCFDTGAEHACMGPG